MNKRSQLLCTHSALVFATLVGVGMFAIAGWMPPLGPAMNAADLSAHFQEHRLRIRVGISVLVFASVFYWPMSAAIGMQMRRIEGESHPLTYVQMASSCGTVLMLLLAAYAWLVAAYRSDIDPATLRMMNDFAWLSFVGAYSPGFLQNISIGLCIVTARNDALIYPRWVGFLNIWVAILLLPGALLPFFHGGPFSWNGIIGFWLVAFAFFGWILVMWYMTMRAIKNEPSRAWAAAVPIP